MSVVATIEELEAIYGFPAPKTLPTPGRVLAEMSENRVGSEQYDREWPERARQSMW
jgi:hypothetical protein